MKYSDDVVEKVVSRLLSGEIGQRELAKVIDIPRSTVRRWLNRKLASQPARFNRRANRVWNKTIQPVLDRMWSLLKKKKSTMLAWLAAGKTCLRTVQRYNKVWFPPKPKRKIKSRRYERRHALSLLHTDWAEKRILNGQRCCFTFYVDDASRKLFALRAYKRATLTNTIDCFEKAKNETNGFRQVLTDNGRQYHKNFDAVIGRIKHLRTRIHNPKCNGKAEAVVKKIKRFLNRFIVRDLAHANRLLARYQQEYNETPHSSLKYQTPNKIFQEKRKRGVISAVT